MIINYQAITATAQNVTVKHFKGMFQIQSTLTLLLD